MSRRRRLLLVAGALILVGTGAAVVHVGVTASELQRGLGDAQARASAALQSATSGDLVGAEDAATRIAADLRGSVPSGDPVWALAETVPLIGPNLHAARVAASSLVDLGDRVAPPLWNAIDALADADMSASVGILEAYAPRLHAAAEERRHVAAELAGVDRSSLIPQLADGVDRVSAAVDALAAVTDGAAQAAELLPPTLGAGGDRSILVVVQNPAELRTGGGITGTFLELAARDGVLRLVAQRDSTAFEPVSRPLLALHAGEERALGDGIGRFVQNASMTADFSLTARLASAWWTSSGGAAPDVVLSVDPLVLSALLGAIGPVDTAAGPLDQANVVDRLLVDPYVSMSSDVQSRWFADAASAVFRAITERARPVSAFAALSGVVGEGRVSMWSRRESEQAVIESTPLAGPLARLEAAGPDAFGVYVNDATGGKLTPYLGIGMQTRDGVCRPDGLREVEVEVDLSSALTAQDAESLPISVTGGGIFGTTKGYIAPTLTVVAPPGWFVGGLTLDGAAVASADASEFGRRAVTRRVDLPPGAARTLIFRFIAGPTVTGEGEPMVLHTPLLTPVEVGVGRLSCPAM